MARSPDPQVRFAPLRAVRMLGYAADTLRGAIMTPARARRRTPRVTVLISVSAILAGLVVYLWHAAQAPGDWVNYLMAACLFLLLLAVWLASRWARTRRA